jgi:hypothetical protein
MLGGHEAAPGQPVMVALPPSSLCFSLPACLQLLSRLQHPHIIRFIGACLAPPNVCIIEELAEGGSLHSLLYGRREEGGTLAVPVSSAVQGGPGRPVKLHVSARWTMRVVRTIQVVFEKKAMSGWGPINGFPENLRCSLCQPMYGVT